MGTERRGQAMIELAMGMFALALVVSALVAFAICIVKDIKMQNSLRVDDDSQHDTVEVSGFAAKYVFGKEVIKIEESVKMPERGIR